MGRLTSNLFIMSGILLLFYLTGLINYTDSVLLNVLLNPSDILTSQFYTKIANVVGLLTLTFGGVIGIVGVVTFNLDLIVMTAISTFLLNIILDFLVVFNKVYSVMPVVALIVFAPLILYWVLGVVEYWRGRD